MSCVDSVVAAGRDSAGHDWLLICVSTLVQGLLSGGYPREDPLKTYRGPNQNGTACPAIHQLHACATCRPLESSRTAASAGAAADGVTGTGVFADLLLLLLWMMCLGACGPCRLQATGYGGTVSQTHNIEAKLKAREANPDASLEERAKQREVSTESSSSSCQGVVPVLLVVLVSCGSCSSAPIGWQ